MKFTIKNIVKKITNLPEEMRFRRLNERSSSPDFTEYHELAECFDKGIGTKRNYKQALKWYIKEAETGSAEAQYALGMRYWKGEKLVGGEKNEDEALRWMEIAAERGHRKATKFVEEHKSNKDFSKLQDTNDEEPNFLGTNLEQQIKDADTLEKLAALEETAYACGKKDFFLEAMENLIYDDVDNCCDAAYCLFSEKDSQELILKKVEEYIESAYEDAAQYGFNGNAIKEDDIDSSVWEALPVESRRIVKGLECYDAVEGNHDLETALIAYTSPDFEDLEGFSADGIEYELEELYNEVADQVSFIDLFEKYGDKTDDVFLGREVAVAYYEEGLREEDNGEIETAVEYYKKAAEGYGNKSAQIRLKELYEEE